MNFWEFFLSLVDRLPGWPTERQFIATITFVMGFAMLIMARNDAALWSVELFKTLITVVIVTGCINMILAFHYAANKSDEDRTMLDQARAETTNKAFEAITATATGSVPNVEAPEGVIKEGDTVVLEKKNEGS